ncbi:hypothetical protein Tco_0243406 [Tanacetum coccineum]
MLKSFIHPGNSQGIRKNLPGSPSFRVIVQDDRSREQCSFIEVRARQGQLEVEATSVKFLFIPKTYGGWGRAAGYFVEQEGALVSFVTSGIGFTTEEVGIGGVSCPEVESGSEIGAYLVVLAAAACDALLRNVQRAGAEAGGERKKLGSSCLRRNAGQYP